MNRSQRHGPLGVLVPLALAVAVSGVSGATDIGIPPVDELAYRAEAIVEGRLQIDGSSVVLLVERSLKGQVDGGRRALRSEHSPIGFRLEQVAESRSGQRLVVLGRLDDESGAFVLPWLEASIWPAPPGSPRAAPTTLDSARSLVLAATRLEQAAGRSEGALAEALLGDLDEEGPRLAVLGFLQTNLVDAVEDHDRRRELVLVVATRLLDAGFTDRATVESVVRLSPLMPTSVAIRTLLPFARSDDPTVAERAYNGARSVLRAKRLIASDEVRAITSLPELETIAGAEMARWRSEDARQALALFDSPIEALRNAAGASVEAILGPQPDETAASPPDPAEGLEAVRAYWTSRVDALTSKTGCGSGS